MTDQGKNLLRACLKGDKSAWNAFVLQYSKLVYYTIKNTLGQYYKVVHLDVVEDLYQEFFLALLRDNFKKLRQFRGNRGCSLASWLRVIATRLTIDLIRSQGNSSATTTNTIPVNQPDFSTTLIDQIDQEDTRPLSQAMETLSPQDRYFIELHFQHALPPKEIAGILRLSIDTVYNRKSRILGKLRETLKKSATS